MTQMRPGEGEQKPRDVVQAAWYAGAGGLDWDQEKLDTAWNAAVARATRIELADAAVALALTEGGRTGTVSPWDASVCEILWQRLWAAGLGIEDRDSLGRHPLFEGAHHAFHPAQTVIRYMIRHNGDEIPGEQAERGAGNQCPLETTLALRSNAPAGELQWAMRAVEAARASIAGEGKTQDGMNQEEDAAWQRGMARGVAHALMEGYESGPHGPRAVLQRVLMAEGPLMGRTLFGAVLAETLVERMIEGEGVIARKALTVLETALRYGAPVRMPTGTRNDVGGAYARAKEGAEKGNPECARAAARMRYYDPAVDRVEEITE